MSISLFKHNQDAYESALSMLFHIGKAAVVHPTGTGKSFIAFKLCEDYPSKRICWLSPSEYIFKTQCENVKKAGGKDYDNIVFFTYAKLMMLSEEEMSSIEPDFIVLDEFHRCGAEMWGAGVQRLLDIYSAVPLLGLSATAIRYLDNQRNMADELFEGNIASEITLGEAIVRGILAAPKYVLSVYSYQKALEKYKGRVKRAKNVAVRDSAEKYLDALRRALEKAEGLDDVFAKHIPDPAGKYIVFCANYEHMREMVSKVPEWFGKVDKAPKIYTVYSDDPETDIAFSEFKADSGDRLKLLFCIDMLNEGIHVDDISGVILFRPTVSPIVYKQQIGRALSAGKKKEPIIFDIVNNIENLYSIGTIEQEMQAAVNYYHFLGQDKEIVNESFRIVDELRDAKELFDRLNETLTASWDMMYSCAARYYKENGNLEVQRRYKTPEGYSLGNWIFTQRRIKAGEICGNLDAERIAKLDAIGMVWETGRDLSWNRFFSAAKNYYEEKGDLNVPASYKTKDGLPLGSWIGNIRTYRRSGIQQKYLTPERIALLDEMGMIWSVFDHIWEEQFAQAADFYSKNGHLNIPHDYISPNGLKTGNWVRAQRYIRAGKTAGVSLTEEKIGRLDSIGMVWKGRNELAWERGITAARHYHKEHGDLNVPAGYVTDSGYKLGAWLADRREKGKEKLTREKQSELDALGMVWEKPDPWEIRYSIAKSYYDKHGNLDIPPEYKADGIWIAKWLNEQRQIYIGNRGNKTLTDEQISRLEAIGMTWGNKNHEKWSDAWEAQYSEAKRYYEAHGKLTDIPESYRTADGKRLTVWLTKQRTLFNEGKLPEKQIEKLNEIGMVWAFEDPWETGYKHALAYTRAHGDLMVKVSYVCEDGYALGRWIANQRSNYKSKDRMRRISPERVKRLESIGMVWDIDELRWEEAFQRASEFYAANGHLYVSRSRISDDGYDLYEWISVQRQKNRDGELSEQRKRRLETIGMDWLTSVEREWENNYSRACTYYEMNGTVQDMPYSYVSEDGAAVGQWLWRIKTRKSKLKTSGPNGNQVERLAKLGLLIQDGENNRGSQEIHKYGY